MAKKTVTVLVDDLTGEQLGEGTTVSFALDGASYEIDLSAANAARLREALAPYIRAGRRVGGRARSGTRTSTASGRSDLAEIRAWASSQGIRVSDRGRVAAEVIAAYDAR